LPADARGRIEMAAESYDSRKRHWALLIVCVSIVPMLVIGGVILYYFRHSDREKVTAHLEELVGKQKQTIDSFLNTKLGEIRVLAHTFDYDQLSDEGFLQERLSVMQQQESPVMVDLGVVDAQGTQVAYAGPFRLAHVDYSEADWFQQAMDQEYFISDVFRGLRGLPHFIVAVRSVRGAQPWILRATIDFAAFNKLVDDIRIGQTGSAFILNRDGNFQTEPRHDLDLESGPYMDLIRDAESHGEEIHFLEGPDQSGNQNIYVAAYLKKGDWLLVYQQHAAEAFASFRQALNLTLIILAAACLASVVAAFLLARKMVSYIAESDKQRQIMNQQIVETGKLAAIGELAAGIAHEINNPVATMVEEAGWMEDLLEDEEFQDTKQLEEFQRSLKQIRNQGSRCKQITHKLLSFARKTDARIQEVNLYNLIEEMVALSAQRAKYSNVEIVTTLQRGLPTLQASVSEMQQVFLNLINNAIDAMEPKGGKIHISIRREPRRLEIRVADTGPGIPDANLERIFDPFFTTKPVGKGTGLGLSICYGIIAKMGGKIEVRSAMDVGTTFRIELPVPEQVTAVQTPIEAQMLEEA
jgi:two-component system NtrC family sensor kinase